MSEDSSENQALRIMAMPGELRFTRDGQWMHAGEAFTHVKVAAYFSNHLVFNTAMQMYVIAVGERCVPVVVEDTPLVVMNFDSASLPWRVELSDATSETFAPETLVSSPENVLYCRVKQQAVLARIRRAAMQDIWKHIVESAPGKFEFNLGGKHYPVGQRS